jgi:hypothetical protein
MLLFLIARIDNIFNEPFNFNAILETIENYYDGVISKIIIPVIAIS